MGLPLLAATVAAILLARNPVATAPPALDLSAVVATTAAPVAAAPTVDDPDSVEVTVQRNDTLDRIFRSVGLDMAALAELRARPEVRRALDVLRPGDIITLTHLDGALLSLNRRISDTLTLSVARSDDGYAVNYIENPLETQTATRHARIDSSLFQAGQDAGISAPTIMTLATQMFGWDIDFALDIRQGDEFNVVYEQKYQDGEYVGDGKVLAADFVNQGKTHRAVWFESGDGEVKGYFTPDGKGLRKAFLRAPLDFTRISSAFNSRRLHPILGIVRAHKGTDYAAPTGTPIWSAGEGRIAFAGPQGRLRQRDDHRSRQGHLDRLRPHVAVRQVDARRPPRPAGRDDRLRGHDRARHRPAPALRIPGERHAAEPGEGPDAAHGDPVALPGGVQQPVGG